MQVEFTEDARNNLKGYLKTAADNCSYDIYNSEDTLENSNQLLAIFGKLDNRITVLVDLLVEQS